jgi:hypothetical protein
MSRRAVPRRGAARRSPHDRQGVHVRNFTPALREMFPTRRRAQFEGDRLAGEARLRRAS